VADKLEVRNLRRRLVLLDALALAVAWSPMEVWKFGEGAPIWKLLVIHAVLIATGLAVLHAQGLYLARVASSRPEEIRRLVLASIVLGVVQSIVLSVMSVEVPWEALVVGPMFLLGLLLWFRGGYRAWLSAARAKGHYLRDVLVIGTNDDAASLIAMLREHPEAGFRAVGVVGDELQAKVNGLASLYLGTTSELLAVVESHRVPGVISVAGAIPAKRMMPMLTALEERGVHIQVSNGLHGMSHRRLRATPVAYQSLYYLEPADAANAQLFVKRVLDLVITGVVLLVAAPVMAVIAVAIKVTDGGPVLFRQQRVGRHGEVFHMLKFRSMVVDAEARLAALKAEAGNERHGPLFKLERDPRVTRVGALLRATSLDELPQLFNVVRGEMSVVGPRPALPSEVAQFDDRLLDRLQMPPGITGLWQVEARDNPHFGAYRRLDLFYVDNWSLNLDLVILVATVEQVVSKAVRTLLRRDRDHAAPVLTLSTTGTNSALATGTTEPEIGAPRSA
jgi:exopolysaccharide biosynthesis polyprenyl glycosylphosphotransferase